MGSPDVGKVPWIEYYRLALLFDQEIFFIEILKNRIARRKISIGQIVVMEIGREECHKERN